ncbi:hypothetical protein CYMTET_19458 [Cymbomonas tetramitiformis]|uniref:Uncharacterized protein n=1 Tax=Cymbomonas tetramitiformis TaxID=36881 RepID=A0AAE0G6J8_9CHLO|nr:hypothetical protein CYMTET_19458 [Cymbomonas tetramitiformis]
MGRLGSRPPLFLDLRRKDAGADVMAFKPDLIMSPPGAVTRFHIDSGFATWHDLAEGPSISSEPGGWCGGVQAWGSAMRVCKSLRGGVHGGVEAWGSVWGVQEPAGRCGGVQDPVCLLMVCKTLRISDCIAAGAAHASCFKPHTSLEALCGGFVGLSFGFSNNLITVGGFVTAMGLYTSQEDVSWALDPPRQLLLRRTHEGVLRAHAEALRLFGGRDNSVDIEGTELGRKLLACGVTLPALKAYGSIVELLWACV